MKDSLKRTVALILLLALVLLMMSFIGCSAGNGAESTAAPTATIAPAVTADPVPSAEPEIVTEHQVGDHYEGTITMDGMEETVRYEQIRNDTLGFEMGYDYDRFERYSEPDRERFILKDEDPEDPEVYLEVTRRAEDAETTAASIGETLSKEYGITEGEFILDRAGNCIVIHADADQTGQMTMDRIQVVYIIPAADGCLVAWGHNTFDSADAFGALYRKMMHTFAVLD